MSANTSNNYSLFEVLYRFRSKCQLTVSNLATNFKTIHPDFHDYVKHHGEKLEIICEEVRKKSLRASKLLRVR